MNSILTRRRALMGKDAWEDITDQLSFYNGTGTNHTQTEDYIMVYSVSDGSYRSVMSAFTTSPEYAYKATFDRINVKSGAARFVCRTSSSNIISSASSDTWTDSQGAVVHAFDHNANIAKISLFCTASTSGEGNVRYYNFRLWRKKL